MLVRPTHGQGSNGRRAPRRALARRIAEASGATITAIAIAIALALGVGAAAAQDVGLCLGNSGAWTVQADTTYSDANGTWICSPDDPNASAGGWLLSSDPSLPTPAPPSDADAVGTNAIDPWNDNVDVGHNRVGEERTDDIELAAETRDVRPLAALVAATAVALALGGGAVVHRLRTPRLRGWLVVEEEEEHARTQP